MPQLNYCYLQRLNRDNGNWETIQERYTEAGGTIVDHFFDTGVPTRWGGADYRIYVVDNNGNPVGVTSLVGVTLSR